MRMLSTVIVIWVVILVLVVLTLFAGVKTVPQGQIWTVERFGAYTRLLQPGLQFVLPYIDRIGRKLNVQEQVVEIPEQSVITRDNATVLVDGIIYFRIMEPEKAAYQVQNLTLALTTLAMTNIRAVIGEMELDATLSSRERINTSLLEILDGATMPWGVKVSRVEIRKIEPPENLIRAMNLQMTAERERRAVVARADGEREAAIKRAEGEKQALILAAEGRQLAALRDAEARVALSRAEAESTQLVSDAAARHGAEALRYFVASNYIRAFQAIASAPNSRLVVVPMESASIAGGITQAMELLRAGDFGPFGGGSGGAGGAVGAGRGPAGTGPASGGSPAYTGGTVATRADATGPAVPDVSAGFGGGASVPGPVPAGFPVPSPGRPSQPASAPQAANPWGTAGTRP
jgi:regulator of protease activity HflC (stomatin/prohibitin superfamily)